MVEPVYKAMMKVHGMGPRDVDQLYIWEIASLLGVGDDTGKGRTGRELIRQRIMHSRGLGPAPKAQPVDPEVLSSLGSML